MAATPPMLRSCRVGKGAGQVHRSFPVRRHSAVHTLRRCEFDAARSSPHLPQRRAIFLVFELHPNCLELVTNTIGLLEVLRPARGIASVDERHHLALVDGASALGLLANAERAQRRPKRRKITATM